MSGRIWSRRSWPTWPGAGTMSLIRPGGGGRADWPDVTLQAAEQVAGGAADEAIVMCWTGTGCTISREQGAGHPRRALRRRRDGEGARTWNHANVLALSLRATPEAVATEILDAWFSTPLQRRRLEPPPDGARPRD